MHGRRGRDKPLKDADNGVIGPPDDGNEVAENVGDGVGGKVLGAKWTCFPIVINIDNEV